MKLNNNGWGLNTLLMCMCGILFALLISVYYVYRLNREFEKFEHNNTEVTESTNNFIDVTYYNLKEEELRDATSRYINDFSLKISEDQTLIIELSELIKKEYIDEIYDSSDNKCTAYSLIEEKDGVTIIKPYINCNNYKTYGYGEY